EIALPSKLMEIPKSPCNAFPIYKKNCSHVDLSNPYLAYNAFIVASGSARSPMNGSPGNARIIKNVSRLNTNNVTMAYPIRFAIYFAKSFSSLIIFFPYVNGVWNDSRRSEEHTSELQSRFDLVCRLLLEKKNK